MNWNMHEWVGSILGSSERTAMPIMTYPGLDLIGKTITEAISSAETHFACIKALSDKYPTIATTSIMDLSVEAEAFGSPIAFGYDEVPTVTTRIVGSKAEVEALQVPEAGRKRTAEYIRTVALASSVIQNKPVFGGIIGPFSLSGRLYDMTEIMTAMMLEPEVISLLLDKVTSFLLRYAGALKAAGANGIVIAEPAAGLLSPALCHEFSSTYVKRIVDRVQDDSFLVILHNCGADPAHVPSMLSTGARGLHFGNKVRMAEIIRLVPRTTLTFGNLDPARTIKNGSPEELRRATNDLLRSTEKFPNFVLSSGCDVPPHTPLANIEALYETLALYNAARLPKAAPAFAPPFSNSRYSLQMQQSI